MEDTTRRASRLDKPTVRLIRRAAELEVPQCVIAQLVGRSRATVCQVINRKAYRNVRRARKVH